MWITLDQARQHTRSAGVPDDADLTLKIRQAEAIVWTHLKRDGDPPWTTASDPTADLEFAQVQAATLKVIQNLYRFRGDDDPQPLVMSPDVLDLLSMLRKPTMA